MNQWVADHCQTLVGGRPILAMDMYEHSYHIDYGAKAATYVDTFMKGDPLGRCGQAACRLLQIGVTLRTAMRI